MYYYRENTKRQHDDAEKGAKAIVFLFFVLLIFFQQQVRVKIRNKNKNKIHSDHFPIELKSKETQFRVSFDFNSIGKWSE